MYQQYTVYLDNLIIGVSKYRYIAKMLSAPAFSVYYSTCNILADTKLKAAHYNTYLLVPNYIIHGMHTK